MLELNHVYAIGEGEKVIELPALVKSPTDCNASVESISMHIQQDSIIG